MFLGNPEYGIELPNIEFAKVTECFGLRSLRVDKTEDIARVIIEALQNAGPVLVEAAVDPLRKRPSVAALTCGTLPQ